MHTMRHRFLAEGESVRNKGSFLTAGSVSPFRIRNPRPFIITRAVSLAKQRLA